MNWFYNLASPMITVAVIAATRMEHDWKQGIVIGILVAVANAIGYHEGLMKRFNRDI